MKRSLSFVLLAMLFGLSLAVLSPLAAAQSVTDTFDTDPFVDRWARTDATCVQWTGSGVQVGDPGDPGCVGGDQWMNTLGDLASNDEHSFSINIFQISMGERFGLAAGTSIGLIGIRQAGGSFLDSGTDGIAVQITLNHALDCATTRLRLTYTDGTVTLGTESLCNVLLSEGPWNLDMIYQDTSRQMRYHFVGGAADNSDVLIVDPAKFMTFNEVAMETNSAFDYEFGVDDITYDVFTITEGPSIIQGRRGLFQLPTSLPFDCPGQRPIEWLNPFYGEKQNQTVAFHDDRPQTAVATDYFWFFGDDQSAHTNVGRVNHTYKSPNVYLVRVNVQYNTGGIENFQMYVDTRGTHCSLQVFAQQYIPVLYAVGIIAAITSAIFAIGKKRKLQPISKGLLILMAISFALPAVVFIYALLAGVPLNG